MSSSGRLAGSGGAPYWLTPTYDTALIGKYLNGYGTENGTQKCQARYIPTHGPARDWDYWHALLYAPNHEASYQYGYWANLDNNRLFRDTDPPTSANYQTNKLRDDAVSFINTATEPFFLYAAPSAVHLDHGTGSPTPCQYSSDPVFPWGDLPALRDDPTYDHWAEPFAPVHPASYNENTSDKASFLKALTDPPPVDGHKVHDDCIETLWQDRLEALKSIDVMIESIVDAIVAKDGNLDRTVLIFTSDNGYFNGEHRLHVKIGAYEEGLRVPLAIRYPGSALPGGTHRTDMVVNHDLAPTIVELAGLSPASFGVDGQSLVPLLRNGTALARKRFLVEHWPPLPPPSVPDVSEGIDFYPQFIGIRTGPDATPDLRNVLYLKYINSGGPGQNEFESYDSLNNYPATEQQLTDQCSPTGPISCPLGQSNPLDQFLTYLATSNANAQPPTTYTCQALENAAVWPLP